MKKQRITIMKNKEIYEKYMNRFLEENSKVNLISQNEEKFLWEKHVFDSLGAELFFEKYTTNLQNKTLIDIGTGGGFPAIPLAIRYPELKITALDSIRKKLTAIENITLDLKIENLSILHERAENVKEKYDFITSRAVATLDKISTYALPLLKKDGYFIAYKSRKVDEEIEQAQSTIKRLGGEIVDIIKYQLPLEEIYERNLVIIKKVQG